MNRTELIELRTKEILGLRVDTFTETESAKMVAIFVAMLSPAAYDRYIREVQNPALKKHAHSRGFRALHNDLRDGASRIVDEEHAAMVANVQAKAEPEEVTS